MSAAAAPQRRSRRSRTRGARSPSGTPSLRAAISDYEERLAAYDWPGPRVDRQRPPTPVYQPSPGERRGASAYVRGRPVAAPARGSSARRRPAPGRLLLRRLVALVLAAFVASALVSYCRAMLRPSNVSVGVRSVEWLRDHGLAWLVSDVEAVYYSLDGPHKGGPPLHSLPTVGLGAAGPAAFRPPSITPAIRPVLPGEGQWRRATPLVAGAAPLLVTTFRPDPSYPRLVAGVAWIDRSRASMQLYPGRYEPLAGSPRGPMEVPPQMRSRLLATFNSGFKLEDSGDGFDALGHVYAPLREGVATLVSTSDGGFDVRAWTGGPRPGPEVAFARQNLPLIVANGRLNPKLTDGPEWGATLGNTIRVWRSGVGVDARGDLLYAAADSQTVTSLARILARAGAVRAMELDINYEWVSFNTYSGFGGAGATKLLPAMNRAPTRYLTPDDRDFFAVFSRPGG